MKTRPFGLADAMLVVLAIAIAFTINRIDWRGFLFFQPTPWRRTFLYGVYIALPHLICLTLAGLAMRMRQPRPPIRQLFCQPGAMALAAASVVVLAVLSWIAIACSTGQVMTFEVGTMHRRGMIGSSQPIRWVDVTGEMKGGKVASAYGDRVAFAVAGAWLALFLTGSRRPERTWLDRLGRFIGWIWIAYAVMFWAHRLI